MMQEMEEEEAMQMMQQQEEEEEIQMGRLDKELSELKKLEGELRKINPAKLAD